MCRRHLLDHGAQYRTSQPARHLVAQNAHAFRNRTPSVTIPPFAGDDQHQPKATRPRTGNEVEQRALRLIQRHSVQVEACLGPRFAALQPLKRFFVHA